MKKTISVILTSGLVLGTFLPATVAVSAEVTTPTQEQSKLEEPTISANTSNTKKSKLTKDKKKSHSTVKPFVGAETQMDWAGITVTLDSEGTLTVPSGTVINPKGFYAIVGTNAASVKKIVFQGPVTLKGRVPNLFSYLSNLTAIEGMKYINTSEVTDMSKMFFGVSKVQTIDVSGFDTSKVTNMSQMFFNASAANKIDVSNFNTGNVTNMSGMFYNASGLESLDVSKFDTTKVTNMESMFAGLPKISKLDVSNFNTSNVTTMHRMFSGDSSLTNLDLSNFNTSNVIYMSEMFYNDTNLKTVDISSFDTSKVVNMGSMFYNAASLTAVDLSNFNTSNVTYMASMFLDCKSLKVIDASSFDTSKVTHMQFMFKNTTSLEKLDISNFSDASRQYSQLSLENAVSLKEIKLGSNFNPNDTIGGTSAGLPEIKVSPDSEYTGKWQNVGTGTVDDPKGSNIWSSAQLCSNDYKTSGADTYVWEKKIIPIPVTSNVNVHYVDESGNELAPTDILTGTVGDTYTATAKKIDGWKLKESLTGAAAVKLLEKTTFAEVSDTVTGTFTNDPQNVKFVYTKVPTPPVDPEEPTKPTTKTVVKTITQKVLPKTGENNVLNMALLASGVVLLSSVVGYAIYKNKKKVN